MTNEQNVKEQNIKYEIDVQKLVFACLHKWWLIAACAVLAAVLAGLITENFITPMYRAKVTVYVNNANNYEQVNYISSSNLSASVQLVNTYIGIIKTESALEKIANLLPGISTSEILRSMSASQITDTVLFNIYITHPNPQAALDIANAFVVVIPEELSYIVEGSSTKIVDYPVLPKSPVSPNIQHNCMTGAFLGALFAVLIIVLSQLFDVQIRTEEDLESYFSIPVLGQIPTFTFEDSKLKAEEAKLNSSKKEGGVKHA